MRVIVGKVRDWTCTDWERDVARPVLARKCQKIGFFFNPGQKSRPLRQPL